MASSFPNLVSGSGGTPALTAVGDPQGTRGVGQGWDGFTDSDYLTGLKLDQDFAANADPRLLAIKWEHKAGAPASGDFEHLIGRSSTGDGGLDVRLRDSDYDTLQVRPQTATPSSAGPQAITHARGTTYWTFLQFRDPTYAGSGSDWDWWKYTAGAGSSTTSGGTGLTGDIEWDANDHTVGSQGGAAGTGAENVIIHEIRLYDADPSAAAGSEAYYDDISSGTDDHEGDMVLWYTGAAAATSADALDSADAYCRSTVGGQWLLDLVIGGTEHRYSTRPVVVTDDAGTSYPYRAGLSPLEVVVDHELSSVAVQVYDAGVDWSQRVAQGASLAQQRAVLRYWRHGETLEQARRVLVGVTTDPEWGEPGAPGRLVLTLDQGGRASQTAMWPPVEAAVTPSEKGGTFDSTDPLPRYALEAYGQVYPTPIGYPGSGDASSSSPSAATPALMVRFTGTTGSGGTRWMIARGEVAATQVTLWDYDASEYNGSSAASSEDETVATDTDALGQTYSYVTAPAFPTIEPYEGHRYWVGWNNDASFGGGVVGSDGQLVRGLGSVIVYLAERSGLELDNARQAAQRSALDRFAIDSYINARIRPIEWVDGLVAPFPVRRVITGDGIHYRMHDFLATARQAVRWLDTERRHIRRVGPLREDRSGLANSFTVRYQPNGAGVYGEQATLGPENQVTVAGFGDDRVIGSPICAASAATFGLIEADTIDLLHTWSDSTAALLLRHQAAQRTFPRLQASYEGRGLQDLLPGDVVVISDTEAHITERVALVDAVTLGPLVQRLDVTFLPRDTVST